MKLNINVTLAEALPKVNMKLNDINFGGCGVFALELHKALKVRGIKSHMLLTGGAYREIDLHNIINNTAHAGINCAYQQLFKEWDGAGRCALPNFHNSHIVLRVGRKLYDSDGELTTRTIGKPLTIKTMEQFLRMDCWNANFMMSNANDVPSVLGTLETFFARTLKQYPVTQRLNGEAL